MQLILLGLVFLATVTLLVGAYVFANRRRFASADLARVRLRTVAEEPSVTLSIFKDAKNREFALLNRLLAGKSFTEQIEHRLLSAGSDMTAGRFLLVLAACTLGGAILGVLSGTAFMALVLALVGFALPFWWLSRRQTKRLQAFQTQLPDAIDVLVSAMRAGYSFQAAMNFVGEEIGDPLGPEFARFYDEQRLGMDVRTALLGLQERTPSMDLRMFVTAVLVQRESGGNLGEILGNISDMMRERFAVQGEIETLTAESKLSARILSALPIVVFFAIFMLNPDFMRPMLEQGIGRVLLIIGGASVILGYFTMSRIANIDI
ncbi:MAG: type II secretion system F family protein [Gemmatimonadaceae bacterium]